MNTMGQKEKYKKHDEKRQRIQISLYASDRLKMKEKYGKVLSAAQAKEILLKGEYTQKVIEINKTPLNSQMHNQLLKIGNNINQLAYIANAKKEYPQEALLLEQLRELKELAKQIRKLL